MTKRCSLLLVEDDLAVREAITKVLETEGYQVSSAASRSDAIHQFNQRVIDMVLLDLNLGNEEGWTVFEALRERRPGLPIFVTSGRADELRHSKASRASGVLEKPFDMPVLLALLSQASPSVFAQPSLEAVSIQTAAQPGTGRPSYCSSADFPGPADSARSQVITYQQSPQPK